MGIVLRARHIALDEPVALKVLHPRLRHEPEYVGRFVREARAAARIRSEHVGRVLDAAVDGERLFIAMEYLEGHDLAALLRKEGPLPPRLALDCVLQACEAIEDAHSLGIVHRDLKPSNLFLANDARGRQRIKVLDFGIAKLTSAWATPGDGALTDTHELLGSPRYMSPEQITNARAVDEGTDIWALGAILYELLTGTSPFGGSNVATIAMGVLQANPRPMDVAALGIPAEIEAIVLRCLAKERADRFRSVADLAAALAPLAAAIDSAHRPRPPSPLKGSIEALATARTLRTASSNVLPPAHKKFAVAGMLLALGTVAGGVVALSWMHGGQPAPISVTTTRAMPVEIPVPASAAASPAAALSASVAPPDATSPPPAASTTESRPLPAAAAPPTAPNAQASPTPPPNDPRGRGAPRGSPPSRASAHPALPSSRSGVLDDYN
jgi:serine/threonine-protein kinase